MAGFLWGVGVAVAVAIVIGCTLIPIRRRSRRVRFQQAKHGFHTQREWLEAKFVQQASAHAGADVPRWSDCTFADDVAYVRSRSTGELSALVAVTIATDEGDVAARSNADAIGNLQAGTAVFRFDGEHWVTDGRAILNLNPNEAIQHFRNDLEIVGEEPARPMA
jgi:hypothetical protein